MPWTETIRPQYERDCSCCASDMTDAEWALIAPHLPPAKDLGRPRKTDLREVVSFHFFCSRASGVTRLSPQFEQDSRGACLPCGKSCPHNQDMTVMGALDLADPLD
jgi:hypothetical protein